MDEKKTFFASLEPKSALLVGAIGGVLLLGTVGFVVLGAVMLKGGLADSTTAKGTGNEVVAANTANTNQTPQTPAAATVTKSAKPKVELFVMAYCPYGLQMEKAYLPAWDLLKNKADITVKFVDYAMHGLKEIEENTRQYCIQKEQPTKYISYLKCFTGKDDFQSCLTSAGVDVSKLNSCVDATNKTYGIMDKYNDQSTWLSGQYPLYPIYTDLNTQYGVQGSPTLVINGTQADANRTAEGVKEAICASFTNQPSECNTTLDNTSYSAGFGYTAGANTGSADCATPAQ
ncbi:MAG: hypothetical protein WC526_03080 [Patescibacteria group bacterium]